MLRIARMNVHPPGGYKYVQPETGMKFSGNELFRSQCRLILAHRKGNALERATLEQVSADLVAYTCARVPGVCTNGQTTAQATVAFPAQRKVGKCGACGGRKAKK